MALQTLNNGETLGTIRGKINANFIDLESRMLVAGNVLTKTNTTSYTPTFAYHPATKQYVDQIQTSMYNTLDPDGVRSNVFNRSNHTGTQSPATIVQDANNRFVTDTEKGTWDAKENGIGSKGSAFNKSFGTTVGTVSEGNHNHSTEYEAKNTNIQTHIGSTSGNPHSVTKTDVGLGNVTNTSDANKPVSTAQQTALDLKRDLTNRDFGGVANYSSFDTDGHLSFEGDATVWDDINLDPLSLTGNGNLPTKTQFGTTNIVMAGFTATQTDEVSACREYPHDGKLNVGAGTSVKVSFHAHVFAASAVSGDVRLELEYFYAYEGIQVTSSSSVYVTATVGAAAWQRQTITFEDINAPNVLGAQLCFRFARLGADGADTYASALCVGTIGAHYERDAVGSKEILTK